MLFSKLLRNLMEREKILEDKLNKRLKKQANSGKPRKSKLISQTCNPLSFKSKLKQEAQHLTN
jgi:hypothetical protein